MRTNGCRPLRKPRSLRARSSKPCCSSATRPRTAYGQTCCVAHAGSASARSRRTGPGTQRHLRGRELPVRDRVGGAGYRLTLRPELAGLRDRFYGRIKEARLSQQAIDVLALVAYNQPLTRHRNRQIAACRQQRVLSQLVRRGLLRVERPDKKPREPIFHTTDRFLELFGGWNPGRSAEKPGRGSSVVVGQHSITRAVISNRPS